MSKIISSRYLLDKTHGEFLKPHPEQPISAETGWGVTDPSEKQWVERHIRGQAGVVSPERTAALEKQIRTLIEVRREKLQLGKRIAQQRSHIRELQNKLQAAQIKIQRLEKDRDHYLEERNYYYAKQSRGFNSVRKESGLPTLPPASPHE